MDTQAMAELKKAPQSDKKSKVFPCFTCESKAHKVKDCPISATIVKNEIRKQFGSMRGDPAGKNRNRGGRGGRNRGRGSFSNKSEKNVKQEPKN